MKDYWSDLGCSPLDLTKDLSVFLTEIGEMILSLQSDCQARAKSPRDVITIADLESDRRIKEWIGQRFPRHNLLIEESGQLDQGSPWTWVVDPLDGTVNFSRGLPIWGIAAALQYRDQVVLAVCVLPKISEVYTAIRGQGAWLNGQILKVSTLDDLSLALISNGDVNVGESQGHEQLNQLIQMDWQIQAHYSQRVKCFGSAVVEGCWVAAGRLDAYVMRLSHPWDIAAVSLLIQEAGGRCSQLENPDFQIVDLCTALMSNGILHDEIRNVLEQKTPEP